MTLAVGGLFPAVTVMSPDETGAPSPLNLGTWLENKTSVIFGVPGAFTPTCSAKHLPGFVAHLPALQDKGVEAVACHSVNDAFVMAAWTEVAGDPAIRMIADGAADLTKQLGLELDLTAAGMGLRCQRYALILKNREVTYLGLETGQSFGVSSAEAVLEAL